MNKAISALEKDAEKILGSAKSEAEKIEEKVETEAGKLKAAADAEFEKALVEAEKIEQAAKHVVTDLSEKTRNVFVDAEQFAVKETQTVWHLPHNSIIRNPG